MTEKIPLKPFVLPSTIELKLVQVHEELSRLTENSDPKTVPTDIYEVEIAIAKCSVVRKHFLGDDTVDEKKSIWDKVIPRHDIAAATPYKRRMFGILLSAEEIDSFPVSMHTKITILGAQVQFVKLLRRFRFISAYKLYTVVIRPWFKL
jgi:hypothetical protein